MDTILQIGLSNSAAALVLAVVAAVVGLRGRRAALVHALFRNDSAYLGGAVADSPLASEVVAATITDRLITLNFAFGGSRAARELAAASTSIPAAARSR
jgi:hypothetical protein